MTGLHPNWHEACLVISWPSSLGAYLCHAVFVGLAADAAIALFVMVVQMSLHDVAHLLRPGQHLH